MAGLNFFAASFASPSRWNSKSSRNFKNMFQVSIGNRSRSPLRPLSLLMMSLADLISAPRDWAVVGDAGGGLGFCAMRISPVRNWRFAERRDFCGGNRNCPAVAPDCQRYATPAVLLHRLGDRFRQGP